MAASQTATSSNGLVLGPLAPFLMEQYGLDRATVGLSVSALYAGTAGLSLLAGWVNDRFGVRRALGLGQVALGAIVLAASQAPQFGWLLASLVVAGAGYSVVSPATTKALLDRFPPLERGTAVAIKQTGFTIGGAGAAALGPALALAAGWRVALAAVGALPVVLGALTLLAFHDRPPSSPRFTSAAYATPRAVRQVLADPALVALAVAAVLFGMQQAALVAYTVLFFRDAVGLDVVFAGWMLAAMQIAGTLARLVFGWLSDHQFLHRRVALLAACAVTGATGSAALASLSPTVPTPLAILVALVVGVGGLGWVGLLLLVVAELAGPGRAALGVGMSTTFTFVGFVLGPPIFGNVASQAGFSAAWLFTTALLALSLVPLRFSTARSHR